MQSIGLFLHFPFFLITRNLPTTRKTKLSNERIHFFTSPIGNASSFLYGFFYETLHFSETDSSDNNGIRGYMRSEKRIFSFFFFTIKVCRESARAFENLPYQRYRSCRRIRPATCHLFRVHFCRRRYEAAKKKFCT